VPTLISYLITKLKLGFFWWGGEFLSLRYWCSLSTHKRNLLDSCQETIFMHSQKIQNICRGNCE
jgi:hypothetical protein